MEEIYGWIAERHGFDTASLRESARDWWRLGFVLMPIGGSVLVFILMLGAQPAGDFLDALRRQVPDWLPLAAYVTFWLGVAAAIYAWALRRTAKRIAAHF